MSEPEPEQGPGQQPVAQGKGAKVMSIQGEPEMQGWMTKRGGGASCPPPGSTPPPPHRPPAFCPHVMHPVGPARVATVACEHI